MSSLGPSSTDFQLIASVNLTTSIYIISSFTLNRLIKSRIEDRHQAWQMVSSLQKCVKSIQLKLFFVFSLLILFKAEIAYNFLWRISLSSPLVFRIG